MEELKIGDEIAEVEVTGFRGTHPICIGPDTITHYSDLAISS